MAVPRDRLQEAIAAGGFPDAYQVSYTARTASTQQLARAAALAGAVNHAVFVADEQTDGRGRQGRSWAAAPGTALMMSILFRPPGPPPLPHRYTTLVSVALVEALHAVAPTLHPEIKWPNDVLLDGRKVAGVLAEAASDGERLVVIVGAGLNVHAIPAGLEGQATCVDAVAGKWVDRGDLLRAFLAALAAWEARPGADLHATWRRRLWGRGQRVRVRFGAAEQDVQAVVLDAEPDGRLRLRLPDGTEHVTATAELIV